MCEEIEQLKRFVDTGDQVVFSRIVRRHIDMVYSVGYRQLSGDAHLAEDVCQETFVLLAKKAKGLGSEVVLAGWLYRTSRFVAKDISRREQSRRKREERAMREVGTNEEDEVTDWENVRPLLDEAIGELSETDRAVVCLRFFEDCSYPEIGERIGLSDNAARMRLERATGKLAALLRRKGIKSTAVALGAAMGGQIGMAAPAGLAARVAEVGLLSSGAGSVGVTLFQAMNTMKFTLGVASLATVVSVGVVLYQTGEANALEADLAALPSSSGVLGNLDALREERDQLLSELDLLRRDSAVEEVGLQFSAKDLEEALADWTDRVSRLSNYIEINPQYAIPEMDSASMKEWLDATKSVSLDSEADCRKALRAFRGTLKHETHMLIYDAFRLYQKESGNSFPESLEELLPYVKGEVEDWMFDRYEIRERGEKGWGPNGGELRAIVDRQKIDPIWDSGLYISENGYFGYLWFGSERVGDLAEEAISSYRREKGRDPESVDQILPHVEGEYDMELVRSAFEALTTDWRLESK